MAKTGLYLQQNHKRRTIGAVRAWVLVLLVGGLIGCTQKEKIGGNWEIHTFTSLPEAGNVHLSLHRRVKGRRVKVDDIVLLHRAYDDDCVVYERGGPRTFYGICGERLPVLILKRSDWDLSPEGVLLEGEVFVRDGAPWRKRRIVPIDLIKKRAMTASPYRESWHPDVDRAAEMPISSTERRMGMEERNETGRTPLMWLVIQQDAEAVEALISAGADVNAKDNYGASALLFAANEGHEQIVRSLLGAGAKPNLVSSTNDAPLIRAVQGSHVQVALMLIEAGADVNVGTASGTLLSTAERLNLQPVVAALRAAGAKQ